ncbi:MAG: SDR family NAD(P)-dependent oxidoreductase, partial [Verrucomicrobiae bacterium]|nr:SDR family NAD(P)-dependent oxidoreductase [Verrucomicrobiae bacterium]
MSIPIDLSGRTVLVTGSSQGIGAEVARRFHLAGATVSINHPGLPETQKDADSLCHELNAIRSASAHVFPADVSLPEEVDVMMR